MYVQTTKSMPCQIAINILKRYEMSRDGINVERMKKYKMSFMAALYSVKKLNRKKNITSIVTLIHYYYERCDSLPILADRQ